ncbi:Abi-like protein [Micromonospora pattaloongensis]|uniref:Abi-like protein n=1 Tax=Micromonospora pattaloongensis TaxID=405436 RepID=A0A1H3I7U9_9ACTN|nr:Abi family protein [Micromonospora pattaloongensis]SDY23732.1 Abi-like protein [Micromonospora pattaloongensis]
MVAEPTLLEQRFSLERLSKYREAVGGDLQDAFVLYEWNAKMAATFWTTLGHVEVLVRNAMHQRLTEWSTETYSEPRWYLDPGNVFTVKGRETIENARKTAIMKNRRETPGRVVAELTFGFWRFLLISAYDRSLWKPCLRHVWPGQSLRQAVNEPFGELLDLRNRIAHHEPIYNRPLQNLHEKALTLAEWTCPETAEWIRSRCDVLSVLKTRPWTRPAPARGQRPPHQRNRPYRGW